MKFLEKYLKNTSEGVHFKKHYGTTSFSSTKHEFLGDFQRISNNYLIKSVILNNCPRLLLQLHEGNKRWH